VLQGASRVQIPPSPLLESSLQPGVRSRLQPAVRSALTAERQIEPDAVAELDPVDARPRGVARRDREGVALDRAHPEAVLLVEAKVVEIGGRGRDAHGPARLFSRQLDRLREQGPPDAAAAVRLEDCHVLDLDLARVVRLGQLQVAEDLLAPDGDQNPPALEVGIELRRRVLSELEERSELRARAGVLLDADRGCRLGRLEALAEELQPLGRQEPEPAAPG
jgi:hypothetical protein